MSDLLTVGHFDAIAPRYAGANGGLDALYDAARPLLDRELAGRDVLDVGGGGTFPYDRSRTRSVTALDVSAGMLARSPRDVRTIRADARDMSPCADASFDAVLFNLSAHHFAAGTAAESDAGLRAAFAEARRVLRPGGVLLVYEPVLAPALAALYRAAFAPLRALLSALGTPMVHLRSRADVLAALGTPATVRRLPATGWSDPLGGTFPGLVKLPLALHPTRFDLFRAETPRG